MKVSEFSLGLLGSPSCDLLIHITGSFQSIALADGFQERPGFPREHIVHPRVQLGVEPMGGGFGWDLLDIFVCDRPLQLHRLGYDCSRPRNTRFKLGQDAVIPLHAFVDGVRCR